MTLDQLIQTKQEQLRRFEQIVEDRAKAAGGKVSTQIESFRTKRDDLAARLEALKTEASDRVDVLRMGIDSAWDELHTAFEMATSTERKNERKH